MNPKKYLMCIVARMNPKKYLMHVAACMSPKKIDKNLDVYENILVAQLIWAIMQIMLGIVMLGMFMMLPFITGLLSIFAAVYIFVKMEAIRRCRELNVKKWGKKWT